jgi:hypothetical protein
MQPMKAVAPLEQWWPTTLGQPDTAGGQNEWRYAFFADSHRLAVQIRGKTQLYDTGDHLISGVSQQQRNGNSGVTFTSQHGDLNLGSLPTVAE